MTGVAAIAICAAFTSCSKSDELYDPEVAQGISKEQAIASVYNSYNDAFIKTFGQPAADQDWGFGTGTRTARTESNLWYEDKPQGYGLTKPDDLFDEEIEYVMDWFSQEREGHGEVLDVKNYFVQQVAYGNKYDQGVKYPVSGQVFETIRNGEPVYRTENYEVQSKEHMDWIASNLKANVQSEADCDHVNNFNTGSGSLMYMENSETKYGFAFKDSWGTEDKLVSKNYYMVHLVADYKGKHIDGWYVGFDYQTSKAEMGANGDPNMVKSSVKLEPDGKYNDRVVKIVPSNETIPSGYDLRIMAEDLNAKATDNPESAVSDWDFNDVVLDVKFINDNQVKVRLVAAGGTLPLRINGDDNLEVHKLFNNTSVGIMVNTVRSEATKKNVEGNYTTITNLPEFTLTIQGVKAAKGKNIKLEVKKPLSNGTEDWVEMKATTGQPAAKFAVKPTVDYCEERQHIQNKYNLFGQWVQHADLVWYNPD